MTVFVGLNFINGILILLVYSTGQKSGSQHEVTLWIYWDLQQRPWNWAIQRFRLGGSGLSGFNFLLGYDIIALRGYQDGSVGTPLGIEAGVLFNKFVSELRYAISTNPAATIYMHAFLEGGNSWGSYKDYNPFNIYKS